MSREIDQKVVVMQFDNSNFEKNAQQSLSTLEKLKNALSFKGAKDGLKDIDAATRNVNMTGLAVSVETVVSKFSTLGKIGWSALDYITKKAMSTGEALVKNLSVNQVSAGWSKYADKTSAVQTIMAATANAFSDTETQMAAVNDQLEKLSWFTDETSYNFVDMVSNIGKFTSNNIGLEESVTAMQGIATWAAVSGANATEASRAMYNLSQAIGVGAVTAVDWRSIENANMATAEFKQTVIETAESLGTLKKKADGTYETLEGNAVSISNFREALSDKWFTNDVLTKALDKYGAFTTKLNEAYTETGKLTSEILEDIEDYKKGVGDYANVTEDASSSTKRYAEILKELSSEQYDFGRKAFQAAQETKTFAEVIDYTKDAVSSQWMGIFEAIFGDYTNAKKLWTGMSEDFYTLFVEPLEKVRSVVEGAFGSKWDTFSKKITDTGLSMADLEDSLRSMGKLGTKTLDELIEEYGSFEAALSSGFISKGFIRDALDKVINKALDVGAATDQVTQSVVNLEDVVRRVIRGDFGNGVERMERLAQAGYDYAVVQDMVNKTMWNQAVDYNVVSEAQLKSLGYTEEQIEKIKELQKEANSTGSDLNKLLRQITKPSGRELFTTSLQNTLQIVIKTIEILKKAWHDVFPETTSERIYKVLERIHDFTEGTLDRLDKNSEKLRKTFRGLFSILDLIGRLLKGVIAGGIRGIQKLFSKFGFSILDITSWLGDLIDNFRNLVVNTQPFSEIFGFIEKPISKAKSAISDFVVKLDLAGKASSAFTTIKKRSKSALTILLQYAKPAKIFDIMQKAVSKLGTAFQRVKNLIIGWFPSLPGILKSIYEWSSKAVLNAIDFVKQAKLLDTVKKILQTIGKVAGSAFEKLVEVFKRTGKHISEFIQHWKDLDHLDLSTVIKILKDFKNTVLDSIFDKKAIAEKVTDFGSEIIKSISNMSVKADVSGAPFMSSILETAAKYLKKFFDKFGAEDAVATLITAVDLYFIKRLIKSLSGFDKMTDTFSNLGDTIASTFKGVTGILSAFAGIGNSVTGTLGSISKYFKVLTRSVNAKTVMYIAAAIGILTLSLIALAYIPVERLDKAIKYIIYLAGVLSALAIAVGIMYWLAKGTSGMSFSSSVGLIGIVASIAIMAQVVSQLSKLSVSEITKGTLAVGALMLMLLAFVTLYQFIGKLITAKTLISGTGLLGLFGLIGVALAMKILINNMVDLQNKLNGVSFESIKDQLLALFSVFVAISAPALLFAKGGFKAGLGMLAAVGALYLVVGLIKKIEEIDVDSVMKNLKAFEIVFGMLVGLMIASRLAGKNAAEGGSGVLKMAIALTVIILAIKMIGDMPSGQLGKAVSAVSVLLIVMGLVVKLSNSAGKNAAKAGAMLIMMSISIAILVGCMYMLTWLARDKDKLRSALEAIIVLGAIMALFVRLSAYAGSAKGALGAMMVMTAFVAVLAGALYMLGRIENPAGMMQAAGAISAVMAITTIMLFVAGKANVSTRAMVSIGIMALFIATLSGVLFAMSELGVQNALPNALALSALMVALSVSIVILSTMGELAKGAIGGILSITAVIVGIISALILITSAVGSIDKAQEFISRGIPIISKIGEWIGGFVGGVVAGIVNAGLGSIVDNLIDLAEKLKIAFIDIMEAFQSLAEVKNMGQISSAISAMSKMILALGAVELGNAITNLLSNGIIGKLLGYKDMKSFGEKMKDFVGIFDDFPNVDKSKVESAKRIGEAGKALAEFANVIPNEGGVLGFLVGENSNFSKFGVQMKSFAFKISQMPDVSKDAVSNAQRVAEAGKYLAEFAHSMANEGGIAADIFGDNNQIAMFGARCNGFARQLVLFPTDISESHVNSAQLVSEAGTYLAEFASKVKNISTDEDQNRTWGIAALGEQARTFANELVQFPTAVNSNQAAAVQLVADSIDAFSHIADVVVQHKNSYDQAVGNNSFANFINTIAQSVPSFQQLGFILKATNFTTIGEEIDQFSAMLQKMLDVLTSITGTEGSALSQLTTSFIEFGQKGIAAFAEGLQVADDGIIVIAVENIVQAAVKAINNFGDDFQDCGDKLVYKLKEGIAQFSKDKIKEAFTSKISQVLASIRLYHESFYNAGSYLADGYIKGIEFKVPAAYTAGNKLAGEALRGINDAQQSQSPSKLGRQSGGWLGEGYVIGMSDYFSKAADTGEYLAKNSLTAIASTLSDAGSIVGDNMDIQPTITPVINRSAITAGIDSIGTMFNDSKASVLSAQISGQMDANNVVLDYISKLDAANASRGKGVLEKFDQLSKDIYTLGDRIERMELRLDGKALVGGIAERSDREMGRRTLYERRGI